MELKPLLREWRIWVLLITLGVATLWMGPHYDTTDSGDVTIDTRISDRTGIQISGGTRLLLDIESNKTGPELKEQADEIKEILNIRIAASGLSDARVITMDMGGGDYNIQVESATNNQTRLKKIVEQQGNFEARMPLNVGDTKNFTIYDTYQFRLDNSSLEVTRFGDEKQRLGSFEPGERFEIGETAAYYNSYSGEEARLEVVAYDGEDITDVRSSDVRTTQNRGGYTTRFPVVLTKDAAQVSGRVFNNYNPRPGSQLTLDNGSIARMRLYVDEDIRESLTVAGELGLERSFTETTSSIQTSGETAADSRRQSEQLQAILKSGSLPAPLAIESQSVVSASLGSEFLTASLLSIVGALLAVGILVFIRYRDPRLVVPIVLTGASEVYIMLGFWSWFTPLGSLGLSAIAGIIAAVGTGVDDQIIITDESGRERIRDWSDRMKRAFFVIFTSAASTIGAMTPILAPGLTGTMIGAAGLGLIGYTLYTRGTNYHFVAIGSLAVGVSALSLSMNPSGGPLSDIHGFASTTILGIIIGITVTRPAYAKFLEHLD